MGRKLILRAYKVGVRGFESHPLHSNFVLVRAYLTKGANLRCCELGLEFEH